MLKDLKEWIKLSTFSPLQASSAALWPLPDGAGVTVAEQLHSAGSRSKPRDGAAA